MDNKNSFILYYNQYNLIKELNDTQAGLLFKSIYEYEINGTVPELDGVTKIVFLAIKEVLEINNKKYENICERNRKNIQKRWNTKNTTGKNGIPKDTKNTDIDIDIDIDKEIHIDTDTIFSFIEANFGRLLNPLEYEEISTWENNELTRYAIKKAILNGKYNINYISKILFNYKKKNITTVQQAQLEEETFNKTKGRYTEPIPEHLNKEYEVIEATEEEQQKIEELIKKTIR